MDTEGSLFILYIEAIGHQHVSKWEESAHYQIVHIINLTLEMCLWFKALRAVNENTWSYPG